MNGSADRARSPRARLRRALTSSAAGRWVLLPYRGLLALRALLRRLPEAVRWTFASREIDNYTYDLTRRNLDHLAATVALVTGIDSAAAARYIAELDDDDALREHLRRRTLAHPARHGADAEPRYGRRSGWYAIVRATRPRVVVETGVDKGLGTCVLAAALLRNRDEGHPGVVFGTDIEPRAGFLIGGPYDEVATVLYGDSIESLRALDRTVDLFINDSDHSAEYEAREYEVIAPRLAERAIVLGDNAHVSDELFRFAARTGRRFLFFREEPAGHWYPGAGIGIAF